MFLVKAGYDYQGSDVIFLTDTREKAQAYIDLNFEYRSPDSKDKFWKNRWKWIVKGKHGTWYDYIEIDEIEVDVGQY